MTIREVVESMSDDEKEAMYSLCGYCLFTHRRGENPDAAAITLAALMMYSPAKQFETYRKMDADKQSVVDFLCEKALKGEIDK